MLLQYAYNQIVTQSLYSRGLLSEKSNTFGLVLSPSQIPPQPTSYIILLEFLYPLTWNQYDYFNVEVLILSWQKVSPE